MGAVGAAASAGQRVRVLIRPEKIILLGAESEDSLVGRIESALYLGDSTQLRVSIDGASGDNRRRAESQPGSLLAKA